MSSGKCGTVNYIDVYNMTEELVSKHQKEAMLLTYDNVSASTINGCYKIVIRCG